MSKEKASNIEKIRADFENEMIDVQQAEIERKTYSATKKTNTNPKHRRRIITGAVFCLFAFIGVVSVISSILGAGAKIMDNSKEKQMYNSLLAPLVVYDPLPFESPRQADQTLLLTSSVWAAIINEDMTLYERNEYDQALLPTVDVDKYFAKLFGTSIRLTHATFSDSGVDFEYNREKGAYAVPSTGLPSGFTPQVEKIKTSFTEKIVTVGYISPQASWEDASSGSVSKYVDYIFEKQDGQFCLVAIRESEMKVEHPQATTQP